MVWVVQEELQHYKMASMASLAFLTSTASMASNGFYDFYGLYGLYGGQKYNNNKQNITVSWVPQLKLLQN